MFSLAATYKLISTLLKPYFQVALPNNRLAETRLASKKQ